MKCFYKNIFILLVLMLLIGCQGELDTDNKNNTSQKLQEVDTILPLIHLNGKNPMIIKLHDKYIEAGAIATDDTDGVIPVEITGQINTDSIGIYHITYTAMDSAKNVSKKERTIYVNPPSLESEKLKINDKSIIVDNVSHRIFFTLDNSFIIKKDYKATFSWEGEGSFKINGESILNGDIYTFSNITFGSKIVIQRFYNEKLADEYTIVFTNLPVIQLTSIESIKDEPKVEGTFRLVSSAQDIEVMPMGIEIRGATAKSLPKKSYDLELRKNDICQSGDSEKLLALRKDDDWLLDAAYRDTTFVRNIIGHDLFNAIRKYAYKIGTKEKGQAAIKGTLTEIMLNGQYNGIYVLEEPVDRKLLDLTPIDVKKYGCNKEWSDVDWDDPINGSVIYKGVNHDANFFATSATGEQKKYLWQGFEQKYPKLSEFDRREPLVALVDFIINSSDMEFIQQIGGKIDIDNYVDYFLAMMVGNTGDAITKNQYLARSEEGKFFFVPWDWDSSFGISWTGKKDNTWIRWGIKNNGLIRRLYEHPEIGFNNKLANRWNELRNTIFSNKAIKNRFNDYIEEENMGNALQRTFERWPDSGNKGSKDRNELSSKQYLETWIDNRMAFIDKKISELPLAVNIIPNADAGVDQRVSSGSLVTLNASASTDMNGNETIKTYQWIQTKGESVTLNDNNTSTPTFIAPSVENKGILTFQVTVTDENGLSAISSVNIIVLALPKIIINEIHYHPIEGDEYEFIELYNDEDYNVDMSGWYFSEGIEHIFENIQINAKETLVIAKNSAYYPSSIQWTKGKLSNKGELIVLKNGAGQTIDSVEYDDKDPWPLDADGEGPSLELKADKRTIFDNNNGINWKASSTNGGTPNSL